MAEKAAEAAKINADIIQKYADQQAENDKSSNSISRYIEKETQSHAIQCHTIEEKKQDLLIEIETQMTKQLY